MLCYEGKLSLYCFIGSAILFTLLSNSAFIFNFSPNVWGSFLWGPILYFFVLTILYRLLFKKVNYQIAIRATFLGIVFAFSLSLAIFGQNCYKPFGLYGLLMSIFHYTEYLAIAWSNPKSLSVDSFILNHSIHYAVAAVSSWIEFFIEVYFLPDLKQFTIITITGLIICIIGEVLRKLAIITANTNFNHLVQYKKQNDHVLVTHGIYKWMRHPSYVGWFWWSIGTQIVLINPICILLYTLISWKFFHDRIFVEEITLINFFGHEYYEYQEKVQTGLPFIRGYELDKQSYPNE